MGNNDLFLYLGLYNKDSEVLSSNPRFYWTTPPSYVYLPLDYAYEETKTTITISKETGALCLPKYARSHGVVIKEKKPTDTDPTWDRQWSDGWLEQGGIISPSAAWSTINLLKPYVNTQYIVLATVINGNTDVGVTIKNKTISSFTIYQNVPQNWEAKGYAADTPMENTLYPWISAYTSAIPASVAQAAEFTNALTGKANTDLSNVLANIDYVVERYRTPDGNNWYEVWKSGKVRQGGTKTTSGEFGTQYTFLKPLPMQHIRLFATPFFYFCTKRLVITEKTATTFKVAYYSSASGSYDWIAEGQGA